MLEMFQKQCELWSIVPDGVNNIFSVQEIFEMLNTFCHVLAHLSGSLPAFKETSWVLKTIHGCFAGVENLSLLQNLLGV